MVLRGAETTVVAAPADLVPEREWMVEIRAMGKTWRSRAAEYR